MTFKTKPPDTLHDYDNVFPLILASAIPAVNIPNFLMIRFWQDLSESRWQHGCGASLSCDEGNEGPRGQDNEAPVAGAG